MENLKMLEILQKIKVCLDRDSIDIARELTQLEIDNLMGVNEQRCKNTRYHFWNTACKYCENYNCSSNKMIVNN